MRKAPCAHLMNLKNLMNLMNLINFMNLIFQFGALRALTLSPVLICRHVSRLPVYVHDCRPA